MGMTIEERVTKEYIQNKLGEEGYPTYASILADYDMNLTSNPTVVGFMEPAKGRIVLNRTLNEDQVSVIVRHEILHYYLEHEKRMLDHLARKKGLDPDKLDDMSITDLKRVLYGNKNFNVAADYEISNRGYTEKDKDMVRAIEINGKVVSGLVTEDDHPDWVDLSVEEMYDKLLEEMQQNKDQTQDQINQDPNKGKGSKDSNNDGIPDDNDILDDVDPDDLDDMIDDAEQQQDQEQDQGQGQEQGQDQNQEQDQEQGNQQSKSNKDQSQQQSQQNQEDQGEGQKQSSQDQSNDQGQQSQDNESSSGQEGHEDGQDQGQYGQGKGQSGQGQSDQGQSENQGDGQGQSGESEGGSQGGNQSGESSSSGQGESGEGSGAGSSGESSGHGGTGEGAPSPGGGQGGQDSSHAPQIGDKGDEAYTAQEDAEREAEIEAERQAGEEEADNETEEEKQERLSRIKKSMSNSELGEKAKSESDKKVQRERETRKERQRAADEYKRFTNTPSIKKFRDNLNRFIRNEISRQRTYTWKKSDPRYEGSGIMRRGRMTTNNGNVPSINVYFDRSASWGPEKSQVGMDAIATLNQYVKKGEIKIYIYYFNTKIHSEWSGKGHGGTLGTPIMEHIKANKPDNVIIMTDDDIWDIDDDHYTVVNGAVWLLFKGGESKNLIDHIRGKKQTKIYDLE